MHFSSALHLHHCPKPHSTLMAYIGRQINVHDAECRDWFCHECNIRYHRNWKCCRRRKFFVTISSLSANALHYCHHCQLLPSIWSQIKPKFISMLGTLIDTRSLKSDLSKRQTGTAATQSLCLGRQNSKRILLIFDLFGSNQQSQRCIVLRLYPTRKCTYYHQLWWMSSWSSSICSPLPPLVIYAARVLPACQCVHLTKFSSTSLFPWQNSFSQKSTESMLTRERLCLSAKRYVLII